MSWVETRVGVQVLISGLPVRASRTGLTVRQIEVLRQLSNGLSYGQAARALGISKSTVQTHARRAYWRLGACNSTHAVALAFRLKILSAADIRTPLAGRRHAE